MLALDLSQARARRTGVLEDIAGWSEEGGPHTGAYSELPEDAACPLSESVVLGSSIWMEPFPPNGRRSVTTSEVTFPSCCLALR